VFALSVLVASSLAAATPDPFDIFGFAPFLRCEDAVANEISRGAVLESPWKFKNAVHGLFPNFALKFQINEHDYEMVYFCGAQDATGGWVQGQLVNGNFHTKEEAEAERDRIQRAITTRFGAPCLDQPHEEQVGTDAGAGGLDHLTYWNSGDQVVTSLRGPLLNTKSQIWRLSIHTGLAPELAGAERTFQETWNSSWCQKAEGR